tara:strand:- start:1282 stop:2379 length:1098 start_codon:yes stop_codon:yes gene_type:complete
MGVILSDSPKLKSEIMKESVLCCRHVLELDYLRENIDSESYKDNDDPINPFTYNIKEIPSLSEKNQKILGKYKHLLFFNFPDYNILLDENATIQENNDSLFYNSKLDKLVNNIEIPKLIRNINNLQNITPQNSVKESLEIMQNNLSKIRREKLADSRKWGIYLYYYKDIISQLKTRNFYNHEMIILNTIFDEINILLQIVKFEINNIDVISKNENIDEIKNKNSKYKELLDRIDYIEVNLKSSDDGEWLKNMTNGYKVTMNGDKLIIRSDLQENLLDLYSKICNISDTNVNLKMLKNYNKSEKQNLTVIETEATPWAYTHNLVFGKNAEYKKENEEMVSEIVNVSDNLKLPVDYIFGMYKNAFRV